MDRGAKLTKAERQTVFDKFDGHCAYCGVELAARWHADHFEPIIRNSFRIGVGPLHPERHRLDNLMPSCARCNISKGPLSLEDWRNWLRGHVASLNNYNTPYKLAKAFGLIQETGAEITFYFERTALNQNGRAHHG